MTLLIQLILSFNIESEYIYLCKIIKCDSVIYLHNILALGRTGAVVSVADYQLRTKGSLVRDLAAAQFVVALSKSHLPTA